jgi:hypothetical protein
MLQFLRTIALLLLIIVGISNPNDIVFILRKEWLYIVSISILLTLLFIDSITGFIFAVTLIIIYVKIYEIKIPANIVKKQEKPIEDSGKYMIDNYDYITTPQNLEDAQNNAINSEESKKDYKGIKGVYGEEVYSAQGLVSELEEAYYENDPTLFKSAEFTDDINLDKIIDKSCDTVIEPFQK